MAEYRFKGVTEAIQFDGADLESARLFIGENFDSYGGEHAVLSLPGHAWRVITSGEYVAKFQDGYRIYSETEFEALFEEVPSG